MEEPLTILVVDDDLLDRTAVRRALRAAGIPAQVDEATDSESALRQLAHGRYDCVLLDYQLPGADGLEVIKAMRARGITTPVVALTGHGDEQLVVALMKAGATDYLTKNSISPERLAQSVRNAVRVHRAEEQTRQAEQALHASVARLRLLAEASRLLSSALDAPTVLNDFAGLLLTTGLTWCAVDLVSSGEIMRRVAVAEHEDLSATQAAAVAALFSLDEPGPVSTLAVVRSGQPQAFPALEGAAAQISPEREAAFAAGGVCAVLCIPLVARGRVLGAITGVSTHAFCHYTEDDLAFGLDLCQRASIALDNGLLYQAAQEAIELRDNFLSIASHELKTPLTSLYGNAQLLRRRMQQSGELNERDNRALNVIVEQSARLDRMISMLLDISRLQSGRLSIQHAEVDIAGLVRALVEEILPSLDAHTMQLYGGDEPLLIRGDELRLHQVLMNLLQNAVKYSSAGSVVVVRVARHGEVARISVTDQGMGVPPEDIPHLFSQFFRATNAQARNIGGIGLGLYVVHQIVALHGGAVEVQSVEGQGSTFTVSLPIAKS